MNKGKTNKLKFIMEIFLQKEKTKKENTEEINTKISLQKIRILYLYLCNKNIFKKGQQVLPFSI